MARATLIGIAALSLSVWYGGQLGVGIYRASHILIEATP